METHRERRITNREGLSMSRCNQGAGKPGRILGLVLSVVAACAPPTGAQKVLTSQYDNARTGTNPGETKLTPRNVNAQQFGKIFTLKVDGDIYAQPLFLSGVE